MGKRKQLKDGDVEMADDSSSGEVGDRRRDEPAASSGKAGNADRLCCRRSIWSMWTLNGSTPSLPWTFMA